MGTMKEMSSLHVPEEQNGQKISLPPLKGNYFPRGLDTATRAIYCESQVAIGNPERIGATIHKHTRVQLDLSNLTILEGNRSLARFVREKCVCEGFVSAWKVLVEAVPQFSLGVSLVEDVGIAAKLYEELRKGNRGRSSIDVAMCVGSEATYENVHFIGPKSLGGNAWRENEEYMAFLKNPAWNDAGYALGIPPCVAMGWIGVQMKVTPTQDAAEVVRLQLLGTIDFDLDERGENKAGMQSGFDAAAVYTKAVGTKLQGAAIIAMLNYDLQNYIRPIQNGWAAEKHGPYNLGPVQVSPHDWTSYLVADCAALVPFAYDKDYNSSKTGMVAGMILLQCQDLLFDTGCSNRAATVPYVEAAGVAKYGMHAAFPIAAYEAIAKYFVEDNSSLVSGVAAPPFGYSACLLAGPWGPFSTRYRCFERCVKYIRQLKDSSHPEAKGLLELSSMDLILKDFDLKKDIGGEFARAMRSNVSDLCPRSATKYFVNAASELFRTPGVDKPNLCVAAACADKFEKVMASETMEEVHAMAGLPDYVVAGNRPAQLAVGLRRAALWASTKECCDVCACRIGFWADAASYSVLSALMRDEASQSSTQWLLSGYFVGCVSLWPVSMPFLLSGFDLMADLSFQDKAMGVRDCVDV